MSTAAGPQDLKHEPNVRSTDAKARVTLPKGFTNSLVEIEQIDEFEVRIRKVVAIPSREAWLWKNPKARESVSTGLAQAENGELVDGPDLEADAAELQNED